MLGSALSEHWLRLGAEVWRTSRRAGPRYTSIRLDLSEPENAWGPLPSCRTAVICAGITSLDECRRDPDGTRRINVLQTLALARRLAGEGVFLVYLSTNLVFDGSKPCPQPDEPVSPRTEYGRQKAEVEAGLAKIGSRHAIVRLTKVIYPGLPLLLGWRGALNDGRSITPFSDKMVAPISLRNVLQGVAAVTERELEGVWQFSPANDVSYAEIATSLGELISAPRALIKPVRAPLVESETLPRYGTLDASRPIRELNLDFHAWAQVVSEIGAGWGYSSGLLSR